MEQELSKLKSFKQITLSETEGSVLRAHIARTMMQPSPLITESLFQRGVEHGLRIALSTMLFIIFVGGSVSAVADNSLPGDPLYTFKINVNEEVKGFFLSTPEEKVVWQKNRIENRLGEIKTLASTKSLTKAKQVTAQKAIDSHIADLSKNIDTLSAGSAATALTVTASLEESLTANKQVLETSTDGNSADNAAAVSAVNESLAKVSDQEIKIIAKEIDSLTAETAITATTSATIVPPVVTPTTTIDSGTTVQN